MSHQNKWLEERKGRVLNRHKRSGWTTERRVKSMGRKLLALLALGLLAGAVGVALWWMGQNSGGAGLPIWQF